MISQLEKSKGVKGCIKGMTGGGDIQSSPFFFISLKFGIQHNTMNCDTT
jgi:hypothetical protein